MVTVIIGSEICTYRTWTSFVVKEISRNKVVILEGAAGLIIINHIIPIS